MGMHQHPPIYSFKEHNPMTSWLLPFYLALLLWVYYIFYVMDDDAKPPSSRMR